MRKGKTQLVARALQDETGAAYRTCLTKVRAKMDELIAGGMGPGDAVHEVAVMKPAELGLRVRSCSASTHPLGCAQRHALGQGQRIGKGG